MKKLTALALVLVSVFMLFSVTGCFDTTPETKIEIVEVLYVDNTGFVATLDSNLTFVSYVNADTFCKKGDLVEINYPTTAHYVTGGYEIGGYNTLATLTEMNSLVNKSK